MEKRSNRQGLLQSYISSQWPDLPARFESLNDDTLTTVLEFVGNKSYSSFGVNKRCKDVYLATKGMTKQTFLFGYGPLSRITDRVERSDDIENDLKLQLLVGAGVVFHNRRDVMDWAIEERNKYVIKGICILAVEKGRFDLLEEVFNGVGDWNDKRYVFGVYSSAACHGKLSVFEWLETHQLDIDEENCAMIAARYAQLHILQWLQEKRGLELFGDLYCSAIAGNQLQVMKWLHEQEVPWHKYTFTCAFQEGNLAILQWLHDEGCSWDEITFHLAAKEGNLNVLQWLHDEGCPWDDRLPVDEDDLKPEVIDWCHVNGYDDRILFV